MQSARLVVSASDWVQGVIALGCALLVELGCSSTALGLHRLMQRTIGQPL